MSRIPTNPRDAAAYWVARMDAGDMDPCEEARWQAWLDEDEGHRGEMLRSHAMWLSLSKPAEADTAPESIPSPAFWQRRAVLAGGLAAGAATVFGTYTLLDRRATYSTRLGEVRRVPLTDGSAMTMNSDTDISIHMGKRQREVSLSRGEAWFEVAKDANRPFVVSAGRMTARAVGTAFSVRRFENAVEIMVTQGIVETWSEDRREHSIRLTAGQRVMASDKAILHYAPSQSVQVERALAWRSGEINLAGSSLAQAAEEFNRYNSRQLLVADPELAAEQIAGVFRMDDPVGFAHAIKASLDLQVDLKDPTMIRLDRRAKP
jgi:transmembrane sensor